ncbi:hypothetical protein CVT24_000758 [Panaeolus cyanescens]|uniref:F-box domain-containing protein n=1 Tax=Panaeolus cyanescens TaxID=181874 RepID=A0A409YCR1_9AGAR|nr:hypothetical protein CVT24_000758 [Panaeolus cyanescens]
MAETDVEMFASRAHSPQLARPTNSRLSVANYPDLLSMICEHLCYNMDDDASVKRKARKDLLSAATAFWNMSEPALNALWRSLPSVVPLIRLLPFVTFNESCYKLAQSQESSLGNWTRFDHYARRVRCLWFESPQECDGVSPFLLSYIARAHKVPLLPGLTSIYTSKSSTQDQNSFFTVLSPSLRMVELQYEEGQSTDFVVTSIALLQDVCPRLEHLNLSSSSSAPLSLIRQFSNPRKLELRLPGITVEKGTIYELGQSFLYLEHLLLSVSGLSETESSSPKGKQKKKLSFSSPTRSDFPNLSQVMTFPNLQSLTLIGDLSSMVDILAHVEPTSLRSLILEDEGTSEGWLDCVSKISTFPYLTKLALKQASHINEEGYEPENLTTTLSALPPHLYLQNLSIDIPLSRMNDEVMLCLGSQFPVLRSLSLPTFIANNTYSSLDSLLLLLQKMPYLDTLNVFLGSVEAAPVLTSNQFHSTLHNLFIHLPTGPKMSTPTALALFCFHVLPGLRVLEPITQGEAERELCSAIKKLLLVFRDCQPKLPGYYQKRLL